MILNNFQKRFLSAVQLNQTQSSWPVAFTKANPTSSGKSQHITYYNSENRYTFVLADYVIDHSFNLDFDSDGVFLRFGLVTKGTSRFKLKQQERQVFFPSPYLCYEHGIEGRQHWEKGHHYEAVEVFIEPAFLESLAGISLEEIELLQQLSENHVYLSLPQGVLNSFMDLMRRAKEHRLTPLYLESQMVNCLSLIIDDIKSGLYIQPNRTKENAVVPCERVPFGINRTLLLTSEELEKVRSAKEMIDRSLPCPPTVQDMSALLQISQQKLTYGFKSLFQETIGAYIKSYRLLSASRLLSNTSISVREVALRTGYSCTANLCNAFKQKFKQSPIAYRNANLTSTK